MNTAIIIKKKEPHGKNSTSYFGRRDGIETMALIKGVIS